MTEFMEHKKLGTSRPMNQVISEYDQVIQQLQQQINAYKVESESLIQQVKEVTDENDRLNQELRSSIESQIKARRDNTATEQEQQSYMILWRQANEELEALKKLETERVTELEKYHADLLLSKKGLDVANTSVGHLKKRCDQMENEKREYLQTAQKLDKEVVVLQEQLSQSNVQLKATNIQKEDLKKSLEETKRELKRKVAQLQLATTQDASSDLRFHSLRTINAELEARVSALQSEVTSYRETVPEMEAQISVLQEKIVCFEKREEAAVGHVKESLEMTEMALNEKQQSEFREQQCIKENKKLKKQIDIIIEEAGVKTQREIEILKTQYNKNIDKMAEEIVSLEKDCSEKQVRIEKVQREKKALENEMKKMVSEGPQEQTWVRNTLSELRKKLFAAERARDDMNSKVKTLELTLDLEKAKSVGEKKQVEDVLEQLSGERKRNRSEVAELREEISSLTAQLKAMQATNSSLERELKDALKKHKKQISILNDQWIVREKDLVSKAKNAEEAHNKITIDLRELVTAQQAMAKKWHDETDSITSKFETAVNDLHQRLAEERRKTKEAMDKCSTYKQNNMELSLRAKQLERDLVQSTDNLSSAESRLEKAMEQLNILMLREKKANKERREVQRQLNHAKIQITRNLSIMDPTALADATLGPKRSSVGKPSFSAYNGTVSAATSFNNTSMLPMRQYTFDGLSKGLHSTPRPHPPMKHRHSTNGLPLHDATNDDMNDTSSSTTTTVQSSQQH